MRLRKSGTSIELKPCQFARPSKETLGKSPLVLPIPNLTKGPKMVEGQVQSLIWLVEILRMRGVYHETCRCGAFELVIQV